MSLKEYIESINTMLEQAKEQGQLDANVSSK
ncbi:hypothetical protein J2S05_004021 [Alkalicoccobacillus murimartini]|uniref:Uncharacterized protein n=1 Tax=Alkalicoccobacillus murimartini TaxID=171685 RepID=A0ABT9YMS0_9BACI|nr:hypothetical protein [Alkalicoccobacillus murimartini]